VKLEDRILEISKKYKLPHIGSCLSVLPILVNIYNHRNCHDLIILDNAHAHVAHLVVKEEYEQLSNIEKRLIKWGIHCERKAGCDATGGSLGHGIGIGIGLAIVDRCRTVHCIVSDGSMMEGSNWEALRIRDSLKLKNLKIYANFNGFTALDIVDRLTIEQRMRTFDQDIDFYWTDNGKGLQGIKGHYAIL